MNANLAASKLELALRSIGQPEAIPKGFRRKEEWERIWGLKPSRVSMLLSMHVKSGRIEMKWFKVRCGGRVLPVRFYKAIK